MKRIYIIIDPGSSNGHVGKFNSRGACLEHHKLPNREFTSDQRNKSGGFKKRTLSNHRAISRLLRHMVEGYSPSEIFCAIEMPGPMPGRFGTIPTYGLTWSLAVCVGIVTMLGWRLFLIPPIAWVDNMFPNKSGKTDKQKHLMLASDLFPEFADELDETKDDGFADILLMSIYTRRKFK
jgi:hypothetical protein